jgi:ferredoxin
MEVGDMKAKVDPELCTGAEICTQVCPEMFEMRGDKAVVRMEEVPKEFEQSTKDAADSCPSEAIIIED